MFNNEKRLSWYHEGALTLLTGTLFGATSVIVGHPFDTVKTKMQAQATHMATAERNPGYIETVQRVMKVDGPTGFYRGWAPPFAGSILFRSLQFSVYEMVHTKCDQYESLTKSIPGTAGIQYRVIAGGVTGATARAPVECPFEYAKVNRQVGQQWKHADIYKGFFQLWPRNVGMFTGFFCIYDSCKRHTDLLNYKSGQFVVTGGGAALAFACIWPFEVLKNLEQAGNTVAGSTSRERIRFILKNQGVSGFYRGIIPGLQSVFLRNGASMVVMQYANKRIQEKGWRQ